MGLRLLQCLLVSLFFGSSTQARELAYDNYVCRYDKMCDAAGTCQETDKLLVVRTTFFSACVGEPKPSLFGCNPTTGFWLPFYGAKDDTGTVVNVLPLMDRERKLDFISLTSANSLSPLTQIVTLHADGDDTLLVIEPSQSEVTTYLGRCEQGTCGIKYVDGKVEADCEVIR